jgi:hypothetical protein
MKLGFSLAVAAAAVFGPFQVSARAVFAHFMASPRLSDMRLEKKTLTLMAGWQRRQLHSRRLDDRYFAGTTGSH